MSTILTNAIAGYVTQGVAERVHRLSMRVIGAILVILLVVGCGGSRAERTPQPLAPADTGRAASVPPTATPPPADTPVPPTSTPPLADTPVPPTLTPIPPTGTRVSPAPRSVSADSLVITNGTVIDGTGADPIADGVVIIAGDRIVAVGRASDFSIPPQAQVIDAKDRTILPGFINAHVHEGYKESNLEAWAQGGVTTVRDLVNSTPRQELFSLRDELRAQPQYARIVAAGPAVTVPDGYPMVPWGTPRMLTVSSPEDARDKVEQLLDDGPDVVKIMLESGKTFGRTIPVLSPDEASTIVQVAHRRGIPVTAHTMDSSDLEKALDAGVDDVAHMIWDPLSDELRDRMVENDVYWVPTLELYHYINKDTSNGWDERAVGNLRRFVAAGGKVALGTDYAGYTTQFELGMPMLEIALMQEAGMTPMQIIIAGTKNAAHVCNLENEIGTLEPGKKADVLVVDGDPLTEIRALARTALVLRDGVIIRQ